MPLPQDLDSFLLMAIFIEGESVTPMLLARRFILNPVLVIVALVFWYWMSGVAGPLLAVPMLPTFKIVSVARSLTKRSPLPLLGGTISRRLALELAHISAGLRLAVPPLIAAKDVDPCLGVYPHDRVGRAVLAGLPLE